VGEESGPRAIKEEPHAQCLGTLCYHEAHVAANVIGILKPINLRLVAGSVPLESRNSFLNRFAKTRADFITILCGAVRSHSGLRSNELPEVKSFLASSLKFLCSLPIVVTNRCVRQITVLPNLGNRVSEKETRSEAIQLRRTSISTISHSTISYVREVCRSNAYDAVSSATVVPMRRRINPVTDKHLVASGLMNAAAVNYYARSPPLREFLS
jgi:hypothetical protein